MITIKWRLMLAMLVVAISIPLALSIRVTIPAVTNVEVVFSSDETQVTISYVEGTWTFPRPVVVQESWMKAAINPFGGKIYWVGPKATDQGLDILFTSIQAAIDVANAGDIVYVNPGTYTEHITISKSGVAKAPIVVSAAPWALGQVRIMNPQAYYSSNAGASVVDLVSVKYVWVNGFVIEGSRGKPGSPASETFSADGITWNNGAGIGTHVTNNVVYNNLHCGLKELGHGGTDFDIAGNIVFENGTNLNDHGIYMPASNVRMIGNIIFNNSGFGIHSYSNPQNQVIESNIIFGHHAAAGIILAGSNNLVYQNDIVENVYGILYYHDGSFGNTVENNIIAFNEFNAFSDHSPTNNLDDYNIYSGASNYPPSGIQPNFAAKMAGAHEIIKDPLFKDMVHGDFRLKSGSPAIKHGIILPRQPIGVVPNIGAFVTG